MGKQYILPIDTTDEKALEQGARAIGAMLSDLHHYLAMRSERRCAICLELEWMDPGEQMCWKCSRCSEALKTLSHPLTKRSAPEDRALYEVVTWMEDISEGQERSSQEIHLHLDTLRTSYIWSPEGQYTEQDSYQNCVLNLLLMALQDRNLFFRRLNIVREYHKQYRKA